MYLTPEQHKYKKQVLASLRAAGVNPRKIPPLTEEGCAEVAERLPDEPISVAPPPQVFPRRTTSQYHRDAAARRRAAIKLRTPNWVETSKITEVYAEAAALTKSTGIKHHVDHSIPLRSPVVSGLHVHTNMVISTASGNLSKGNRFEVL